MKEVQIYRERMEVYGGEMKDEFYYCDEMDEIEDIMSFYK